MANLRRGRQAELTTTLPDAGHGAPQFLVGDVEVALGLLDVGVTQHQLDRADVDAVGEQSDRLTGGSWRGIAARGALHIRKARGLTQEAMAELLGVSQAEVPKMERRSELYIGTLKKFIEAMDGELVLAARFADGVEVPITLAETEGAA